MISSQSFPRMLVIVTFFLVTKLITVTSSTSTVVKVEEDIFSDEVDKRDVIVTFGSFKELEDIALQVQNKFAHSTKEERIHGLYQALHGYSSQCQGSAQTYLNSGGYTFKEMWSSNAIMIKNADKACVNKLVAMKDVSFIRADKELPLIDPIISTEISVEPEGSSSDSDSVLDNENTAPSDFISRMTWGLSVMRVKEAWNYNPSSSGYAAGYGYGRMELKTGKGVVVASIDTGVNVDHDDLKDNHRTHAGWLDGYGLSKTPIDENGHGTHTMGTICGANGIGVAPGSQWISCRGCRTSGCLSSALLDCCQWMLCPHEPNKTETNDYSNCYTAPDLVSNSWGGGQGRLTYERCALALRAAGIIPIFSIGNSGPNCQTANSPGDMDSVIGVGATDKDDSLAKFSSRGPTINGHLKPDISAPGREVRSAWFNGTNSYVAISGTSMAAPHVSGLIALMLERCRLPYKTVLSVLQRTADRKELGVTNQICGGTKSDQFPNNFYGWGRVNALDAVKKVVQICQANKKGYQNSGYGGGAKAGSYSYAFSPYQSHNYGYRINYLPQSSNYGYPRARALYYPGAEYIF